MAEAIQGLSADPEYDELIEAKKLRDLGQDLAAIVYDSGVQLGAGSLKEEAESQGASARTRELACLARLEQRIRDETSRLVEQLLLGWKELAVR